MLDTAALSTRDHDACHNDVTEKQQCRSESTWVVHNSVKAHDNRECCAKIRRRTRKRRRKKDKECLYV